MEFTFELSRADECRPGVFLPSGDELDRNQPEAFVLPSKDEPQPEHFVLPSRDEPQPESFVLTSTDKPRPEPFVLPSTDESQPEPLVPVSRDEPNCHPETFVLLSRNGPGTCLPETFVFPSRNEPTGCRPEAFVLPSRDEPDGCLSEAFVLPSKDEPDGCPPEASVLLRDEFNNAALGFSLTCSGTPQSVEALGLLFSVFFSSGVGDISTALFPRATTASSIMHEVYFPSAPRSEEGWRAGVGEDNDHMSLLGSS